MKSEAESSEAAHAGTEARSAAQTVEANTAFTEMAWRSGMSAGTEQRACPCPAPGGTSRAGAWKWLSACCSSPSLPGSSGVLIEIVGSYTLWREDGELHSQEIVAQDLEYIAIAPRSLAGAGTPLNGPTAWWAGSSCLTNGWASSAGTSVCMEKNAGRAVAALSPTVRS